MILPFIPTPEDVELKINIKEGELVIDLANRVVEHLNTKWDPGTNFITVHYNNEKYNGRVVLQVIDALARAGWKATSSISESKAACINISKNTVATPVKIAPRENNLEID